MTPATPHSPSAGGARSLALVAVFAAFIAVLGLPGTVSPFGNAVPITLQTFGVMLAGSILGARRGAAAVGVLLVLVAAGLPLLAGGRGGLAVFAGPSAGYLIGFLPGAFAIGLLAQRQPYRVWRGALANVVGGIGVIYAIGIPVQAAVLGLSLKTVALGSLVFLPGDAIKAALATAVAAAVLRAVPDVAVPGRRERSRV